MYIVGLNLPLSIVGLFATTINLLNVLLSHYNVALVIVLLIIGNM